MSSQQENTALQNGAIHSTDSNKDMYLSFHIGDERYALPISYVIEIIGVQTITEIPNQPLHIKGVINLRGKIIPVVDVRHRFGMEPKAYGDRTCIIVVDLQEVSIGMIVDEVAEVIDIPEDTVSSPPKTNKGSKSKFIRGITKREGVVTIIVNVAKLLARDHQVVEEVE
jgi:purine-binding chemotaxis protein CheW